MRNSWCETCARKYMCYDIEVRPSCYIPVTSNERVEPPQLDGAMILLYDDVLDVIKKRRNVVDHDNKRKNI
jgi:hypothetical protein